MVTKIMVLLGLMKKNVINLVDLFKKYQIKFQETQNAKYKNEELSARRLLRLFRFQIRDFIQLNKRPSYLYLKYSSKDLKYVNICFPGGEHLVKNQDEAIYLLNTYSNLDKIMNTKFVQRLQRVFIARGVLPPEYFLQNK